MPTYVYRAVRRGCRICRKGFDAFQRMSDPELTACPDCGARVARVPTAPGINTRIKHGTMMDSAIRDKGFTKLTRDADGRLRKAFGNDPAARNIPPHRRGP